MCFYFKQSHDATTLRNRFKAEWISEQPMYTGDFNGFAHPEIVLITNNQPTQLQTAQWGLIPSWAKTRDIQKYTLNARIETIHEKPSFSQYVTQRCLIPADAFYEWQWLDPRGKQKQKYRIYTEGETLFAFAGLWNSRIDPTKGVTQQTCTILTTAANALMARIHNTKKRMPIVLLPENSQSWLETGTLLTANEVLQAEAI